MGWTNRLQAVREFLYGMLGYEFGRYARQAYSEREACLITLLFGDGLGVPLPRSYYALALLPFIVSHWGAWKHRLLRERDLVTDRHLDLHGI